MFFSARMLGLAVVAGLAACSASVPLPPIAPLPSPRAAVVEPAIVVPARPSGPPARVPGASFARPAQGALIARFDGRLNPGIDIRGNLGDPVFASREGRVVVVSSALPAYGTMVVLKHGDTFITAYAHLDKVLVKENESVREGQQIAEMGRSGSDQVKLHFEIRKMGTAVDPEPYLQGLAQ
ncbi:murein hydrolase activator EnvC family protein [Variovorax sp. RT4R15]|uniref:murein hydrolase activator EnvC family protein n=1 Tax=Variovorax sp. RT4R15 TaxID=3443737 RepID=UPI003F488621